MGFDLETRNANDRLVNAVRATESGITAVKTAVELGQMDGNNTRAIGDGQSLPTAVCLGYDNDNGKMLSLDVDSDARLNVNPIGGATETTLGQVKTAVEVGQLAGNNTRGNIGDGQTLPAAICLGYDNDNGKMVSIDVDADGHVQSPIRPRRVRSGRCGSG